MSHYQLTPDLYDLKLAWFRPYGEEAQLLSQHLVSVSGILLELGCGTGQSSLSLLAHISNDIIGIDLDRQMIASTLRRTHGLVGLVCADAITIPLGGQTVSAVYAPFSFVFNMLETSEVLRLMREVSRVLRPGGIFAVNGFDADTAIAKYAIGVRQLYAPLSAQIGHPTEVEILRAAGASSLLQLRFFESDAPRPYFECLVRPFAVEHLIELGRTCKLMAMATLENPSGKDYRPGKSDEFLLILRKPR